MDRSVQQAKELLSKLSLEEKLYQLSSQMIYSVEEDYEEKRDPKEGNYRNPGHFMHHTREKPATPAEVTARINRDVKMSMDVQPHNIPPIEHGEALHGAQWGMATCFPPITALYAARRATSVLPKPTSPQRSLSIGFACIISSLMSAMASSCESVSS